MTPVHGREFLLLVEFYPSSKQAFPEELLPALLLDAAERVLRGTISQDEAHAIWDQGYHAGSYWLSDEFAGTNADLVGAAAWRPLSGIWGQYFLENVKIQDRQRVVIKIGTAKYTSRLIPSDEWTNKLIFECSCADTVLYVAGATARDPSTGRWDKETLRAFGLWWLREAIPLAWETVT